MMHVIFFIYLALQFGNNLKQWIADIAMSDMNKPLDDQGLIPEIKKAVIACDGKLMPSFEYIT